MPGSVSCIAPDEHDKPACDTIARRILASTVRVIFMSDGPDYFGHGTVIGGRYVVTHNHYSLLQPEAQRESHPSSVTNSLAPANGDFILWNAPLSNFTVITYEPGMLLLDFRTIHGTGFFDYHGIPSATPFPWDATQIPPGSDVAQINWDGTTTSVQWSRLTGFRDCPPGKCAVIDNFIALGASGGGVFFNGHLIGNNWLQGKAYSVNTATLAQRYSVAALNSEAIRKLPEIAGAP